MADQAMRPAVLSTGDASRAHTNEGDHSEQRDVFARYGIYIVVALAIAASIASITNGFAFDDVHVIINNPRLHTLASPLGLITETYWRAEMGSMLYRPMTMIAFALQWAAGGGSALAFHLTSIALYAALTAAVYRLAKLLMPVRAAVVAGSLFAVHPVHVEAVANIVGQTELWVALLLVSMVTWYIRIRSEGSVRAVHVAVFAAGYFIACGFKEHAIVLPALIAAAEIFVVRDARSLRSRFVSLIPLFIAMAVAGGAFLAARHELLSVAVDSKAPILKHAAFGTRFLTMLNVVSEWVRLFFWPMSLSADYSYPRIRPAESFEITMLPGIAVLVGLAWVAWTLRKRSPSSTFGITWTGIALLIPSNLVVVTGFVLAERTLMLPSVGFALCVGIALDRALALAESGLILSSRVIAAAFAAVLVAFTARSLTRDVVWRDNETLFRQTVLDVPSSHRAHWMRAADLAERKRTAEALEEMDLAIAFGDRNDPLLLEYGGDMFAMAGRCPRAVTLYRRALALAPRNIQLRSNTAFCLMKLGKVAEAKSTALALPDDAGDARLVRLAHVADSLLSLRTP